ncbi:hypothetical protein SNOG_05137 [Parastagonospora nodorum SN15]|uniref:Uncharacterized protein n=1 Tax=Phaeosphaeria nodorum (strain SN15 / ATCC MYA-4574 / FGSC 10173) TaxID=321614 RepID=Q0USX7_PHANO|nr:hypothetical protein SNOG_05137 [Parastagonospora nodorum SN15]EAT87528.1 hypothetical protein SNOG_05137 [Parastagonospora nodorum SN15]
MAKPNAPKLSLKSKGFREQNSSTFSISRNRGLSDVLDRRQRRQTSSFGEDDLRGLHVPRERPQPDVRLALADRAGGRDVEEGIHPLSIFTDIDQAVGDRPLHIVT